MGLETATPRVFIRSGLKYEPRLRFTLAHELGHLAIPWHIGIHGCEPDPSASSSYDQEREADRFAGAMLLPVTSVRSALNKHGLSGGFQHLAASGLSAGAFAIAMSRYLLPGFFLVAERGGDQPLQAWSKGSGAKSPTSRPEAQAGAIEFGSVVVAGKTVEWYRYIEHSTSLGDDADSRSTTQILRDAIGVSATGEGADILLKRINGVVGGKLSTDRASTPEAIYALLQHNTLDRSDIPYEIRRSGDFDLYLRRKARERALKMAPG